MAMSVKVRIDPIRCRGHAICALLFSDGVELDDWGFGRVFEATPDGRDGLRRARRAAAACPNGAIVISGVEVPAPRLRGQGRRT
jgi:ferredoxin